jgi:hypothetical protein
LPIITVGTNCTLNDANNTDNTTISNIFNNCRIVRLGFFCCMLRFRSTKYCLQDLQKYCFKNEKLKKMFSKPLFLFLLRHQQATTPKRNAGIFSITNYDFVWLCVIRFVVSSFIFRLRIKNCRFGIAPSFVIRNFLTQRRHKVHKDALTI